MAQLYTWPPINATSSSPSTGTTGSPAPTQATEVGGVDGGGILRAVSTDTTGKLNVNISSSVLPSGGATSANQVLEIAAINQVDTDLLAFKSANHSDLLVLSGQLPATLGQKTMANSLAVTIASDQSTLNVVQPDVVATGTITSSQSVILNVNGLGSAGIQITGTWTGVISFSISIDGTNFTNTSALVLSTGQLVGATTANGAWTIQTAGVAKVAVSGTTVATGTATVTIRGSQGVSSVMLDNPIPTGSNTIGAVTQASGPWTQNITQINGSSISLGAKTSANSFPVVIASDQAHFPIELQDGSGNNITSTGNALDINLKTSSITLPVSGTVAVTQSTSPWVNNITQFGGSNVVTGTGTSGAGIPRVTISNDSSLAANQSVNLNQVGGSSITLGSKTSANSVPVVIASDQAAVPTSASGNTPLQFVRNDYSSVNVTTSAYTQLIASTSGVTNVIEIFDSSGQTLKIAFGGSGSEVDKFIVYPGGNGRITCTIPASTRISIKSLTATANAGEIDINLYT